MVKKNANSKFQNAKCKISNKKTNIIPIPKLAPLSFGEGLGVRIFKF
jgi:hypothetical protein